MKTDIFHFATEIIAGPTLSPVASLCAVCAPSHSGNLPDFQHRQMTHFSPAFSSNVFTTLADPCSTLVLMRSNSAVFVAIHLLPVPVFGMNATTNPNDDNATNSKEYRRNNMIY